jgi:hypothetical protein
MNPASHFLIGWTVANSVNITRRDRALVAVSGVIPDIDGIGIIAEVLTENTSTPLIWYSKYHHVFGHNLIVGVFLAVVVFLFGVKRWAASFLALLVFHLHLLGDLVGSRGPDGYQWPIPYFFPFSTDWQLTWAGQWELNAWPNIVITMVVLGITLYQTWKYGRSPLEMISPRADKLLVNGLRKRFGNPISASEIP